MMKVTTSFSQGELWQIYSGPSNKTTIFCTEISKAEKRMERGS